MHTSNVVETYMRLLESETRIREAQLRLFADAQREAAHRRLFVESLIRREIQDTAVDSRRNQIFHPFGQIGSQVGRFGPTEFAVSSVTFEAPETELTTQTTFDGFTELFRRLATEPNPQYQSSLSPSPISRAEIEELTTTRVWIIEDNDAITECPITLQPFAPGDIVRRLNTCGHEFGSDAIIRALATTPTCPLCRANIHAQRTNDHMNQPDAEVA
jgi:hypothetical protein